MIGDLFPLGQAARVAGKMHGDDGLRAGGDFARDVRRVETAGLRFEVGEDGHGLLKEDADDGSDIRDARGDDLVAGRNAGGGHRDMQRRAARGAGLHVFMPVNGLESLREQLRLLVSPVVKGVLLDGGAELLQLRLAPALGPGQRPGDGLDAALERKGIGFTVGRLRHAELAGGQQHGSGGNKLAAGHLIVRSHSAAQCKTSRAGAKPKVGGPAAPGIRRGSAHRYPGAARRTPPGQRTEAGASPARSASGAPPGRRVGWRMGPGGGLQ